MPDCLVSVWCLAGDCWLRANWCLNDQLIIINWWLIVIIKLMFNCWYFEDWIITL